MAPHPCEVMMKMILNDKNFVLQKFVSTRFEEYWVTTRNYLDTFGTPKEQGIFKTLKYANIADVTTCMKKLIEGTVDENYSKEVMDNMCPVFQSLLHYKSPDTYRIITTKILFRVFTIISDSKLTKMTLVFSYVIPYPRFARNEYEKRDLEPLDSKAYPIISEKPDEGKPDSVISQLKDLHRFVINNWATHSSQCSRILFENSFTIIFHDLAEKYSIPSICKGFKQPLPQGLAACVFDFFESAYLSNLDFSPFCSIPSWTMFTLDILREAANSGSQYYNNVLNTLAKLLSTPNIVQKINEESPEAFDIITDVAVSVFSHWSEKAPFELIIQTNANIFANALVNFYMTRKDPNAHIMSFFRKYSSSHYATALFLYNLYSFSLSKDRPDIFELTRNVTVSNELLAAAAIRYAEFIAMLCYEEILHLKGDYIEKFVQFAQRRTRTKQVSECDWMGDNIEILNKNAASLSRPPNAVTVIHTKTNLAVVYAPILPTPEGEKQVILDRFLNLHHPLCDSRKASVHPRLFAPYLSFAAVVEALRHVPPDASVDLGHAINLCSDALVYGAITQSDNQIKEASFDIFDRFVNNEEMTQQLPKSMLGQWYTLLTFSLLSDSVSLRTTAFKRAVKSITLGFPDSSSLIPIAMGVLEEKDMPVDEATISFVGSLALFEDSIDVAIEAERALKKSETLMEKAGEIMARPGRDLRARALDLIDFYHTSARDLKRIGGFSVSMQTVLPVYAAVLADAVTRPRPDAGLCAKILGYVADSVEKRSMEALANLRGLLCFVEPLAEVAPDGVRRMIERLANCFIKMAATDIAEWLCRLMDLVVDLFIRGYKLMRGTPVFESFAFCLLRKREDTHFSAEFLQHVDRSISLLSTFFGRYPFPDGGVFPSSLQKTKLSKVNTNAFVTPGGSTIEVTANTLTSNTISGEFRWHFEPVEIKAVKANPKVTFKDLVKPPTKTEEQEKFSSIFSDVIDTIIPGPLNLGGSLNLKELEGKPESNCEASFKTQATISVKCSPMTTVLGINNGLSQLNGSEPALMITYNKMQKMTMRFHAKIGVIYVGPQCLSQNEILSVSWEKTSPHFREFVFALGSQVKLESYPGYDGGLDTSKSVKNGDTSIASCDLSTEVMFHVAPLIPTEPNDAQQIYKKRHIGNDHITIVWNERQSEYNPQTITSQFNSAHIIVRPLQTGLFRVYSRQKTEVGWFSPIRSPMIVSKRVLPSLVRETAVSAQVAISDATSIYNYPSVSRQNALTLIGEKHTVKDLHDTLGSLMKMDVPSDASEAEA